MTEATTSLTWRGRPQRKVGKRKRLQPLTFKRVPWLGGDGGSVEIGPAHLLPSVTRPSCFRRRCARRGGTSSNHWRDLQRGASALALPNHSYFRRRAEAKPMAPTARKRSARFPWQTRPRRTQCGVGANDGCVTGANGPRCDPLIAPRAPPSQGTHLNVGGVSRFLLPTFLCGRVTIQLL